MTTHAIDIGFVSADRRLVDFLAEVFGFEELTPLEFPQGTVHRLQGPTGVVKVMVPAQPPAAPPSAEHFHAIGGLRYLTLRVDDLDGVVERATARGGSVTLGPIELRPGVHLVVLTDPDGNALEVVQEG